MGDTTLKERTTKGLFWGGMSNGVVQVLGIVFGIIISRILHPGEYGIVGMLAIFSAIATSLQESGFTAALINRQKIDRRDYSSVFWFNILVSFVLYFVLFFCAPLIACFFHTPELIRLSRFVFLGFLIASFGTSQMAYLLKKLEMKKIAISNISSTILGGIVAVFLAYKGFSYWAIVTQSLLSITVNTLLLWLFSDWKPDFHIDFHPVAEMMGFGFKMLITNIVATIGNYLFTVVFGRFYNSYMVGIYNQANKWNTAGYSAINGVAANVSQPVLVESKDDMQRQVRVFRKLIRFVSFVSFPVMFGISLIAPEFIVIAVTDKWAESGNLLRILCIGGAVYPLTSVQVRMILSHGGSGMVMWNNIIVLALQFVICILCFRWGVMAMVAAYTVLCLIWLLVWHILIGRYVRYPMCLFLKDIGPYALISASVMFVTYIVTRSIDNIYLLCGLRILMASTLYIVVMWLSGSVIFKESVSFVREHMRRNK